jgi:hypothetical protein
MSLNKAPIHPMQFSTLIILVIVICAGCTTSITSKRPSSGSQNIGVLYYLPKVEFEIAATWVAKTCSVVEDLNSGDADLILNSDVSVEVTPKYRRDQNQQFYIDYRMLSAPTKKIALTLSFWELGTIKSIDGELTDVSREVISSVITGVASIATANLGVPPVAPAGLGAPPGKPRDEIYCGVLKKYLAQIKNTKEKLSKIEEEIKNTQTKLTELQKE